MTPAGSSRAATCDPRGTSDPREFGAPPGPIGDTARPWWGTAGTAAATAGVPAAGVVSQMTWASWWFVPVQGLDPADLYEVKPAGVVCDGYRVIFMSVRR